MNTQDYASWDYTWMDQPNILQYLFHPRPEMGRSTAGKNRVDMIIPVEEGIHVGASLHLVAKDAPMILFFHGNGEIVSDYDDLGGLFNEKGLNFFVADYRGYGSSNGSPSVTSMIQDAHVIFDFVRDYMASEKVTGSLCVMGRSLGSASALELAATREKDFNALIIESGFAWMKPLLQTLGVFSEELNAAPQSGFENVDKIKNFLKPCLVIHAQYDHIIPFSDGQTLFNACPSENKNLLEIKGANHNDIFLRGMDPYLEQLQNICNSKSDF
jgi:alpha-beta hydrolase superfamily lysophospholipase